MDDAERIEPTLEQWQALYALADRVKAQAPWRWMAEEDIFAIEGPPFAETAFVSVEGAAGEPCAVAVYLGLRGLAGFWARHSLDDDDAGAVEISYTTPHMWVAFGNRELLTERDRGLIRSLGLRYRGRGAWPCFRAIHPGYLPWYLDAEEAEQMRVALEQTLEAAPRLEQSTAIFLNHIPDRYPARRSDGEGGWQDAEVKVKRYAGTEVPLAMRFDLLQAYRAMPETAATVQVDLYAGNVQIGEPGKRPYPPWLLLIVDPQTGAALGTDLFEPAPSLEAMLGQIPLTVLTRLLQRNLRPQAIEVSKPLVQQLLRGIAQDTGWSVRAVGPMPAVEEVKEQLAARLEGR